MSLVKGSEVPHSNTPHANFTKLVLDHKNRQQQIRNQIKNEAESLANEILQEYLDRKPHRSTTGFAKFPTADLVRNLN
jgi:dynactin 1